MNIDTLKYNKITVADMSPHVHIFLPNENKVKKITDWLINWITLSLECGKIKPYDLLPSKADLACHIGVSQGTIQNAFRQVEDIGLVESKQRIGTYIKPSKKETTNNKHNSKREFAIEKLKAYLRENSFNTDDCLISTRKLSNKLGISLTTLQMAINNLVSNGILKKHKNKFFIAKTDFEIKKVESKTLVEKIAEKLRKYVDENLKPGDKLPTNSNLIKELNVSAKTIHDAIKLLTKEGLLYTRRGQYGTIVLDKNLNKNYNETYFYEKFEQKIKYYIAENGQIGEKLPSIKEFAQLYQTSEKTIKRALDNLSEEGYVTFTRGRYGGTFVLDIPNSSEEAYKWLAISSDYVAN